MNNDQLRAMYNIYGTLNRPQSYGDDLYNDRENMMPSAGQELTQTGTDEAGNPVMAPAEAPEAPRQEQAPLNNLIDFARSRMEQSLDNGFYITAGAGVWAPVVEGMRDLWNATPEERAQMLNVPQRMENAVRGVIHGMSNATELEHTQLYENYFYNPQRKNDEINRISKLLQIDGNAFANDRELYQKAALAADRVERMGKFKKYQDAQGNIDMAKIYADIPGLADIQKQQGTAAAALALGNIDGVRSINDVYNNAFTRFVGSVYAGARRGWISDRRSSIWNDARKENRLPNAEEQKELDAYDAELRELPKYNYNTVGNVAGAMVGGAMENMAMIVKSQGAGALAGLAAGRVGGVRAASIARNAASTYVMSQMIAGNQYEELVNRTDVNGRPMYTPEQASWLALAQGAGEAVLEQYSLTQIGKAIFGRSAAKSITEIIKNSPTLEAAKAGVREYASTKIREATKAGLISLGSEAAEEFNQAASDMLMENVAQVMINGKDAELSSIDDILTNSTGQMLEALPAIGGFGLIGFGAHPVANTRAVLGFRSHVRDVVNNKILIGRMANAHYSEVLNGVWDNKKNIKELQDKAPEVAQTILDAQNKIAGIESGFVDVRALRQQEGGEALVQDIAERNNISADELAACLDGSGMLQVKTSTLMQMDLRDAERKAIMDNVTTSLDAFTEAQTKEAVKLAQDQMKSLQNFNDKTYKAAVDNIIAARFPDAEQAKLAREIIETNYDNPQEEFKRRLDAVNAEINEEIEPVLRELRSGMKQGVNIVRVEGERAHYERISNNDPWYSNWYADYGHAPNKRELENLAIDIASGRQDPRYGLPTYQNNTDESREYYAGVAEKLDNLEEQRDALEAIQERMRDLNPGEMVATASLSKEGLKVYDAMRRMMGESENADVQKAGRFNALFLARYADNMAKVFSKVRNAPYTAEDFVRDRFRIDVNAEYNEEQMAAQLFQVSPEEFAKQKEAVRKQYENTDQWLKAPNGKDTNLNEDQWVTVRTDAFKNWFGDWEGNPAEASKVVDENGEPLVVYHKTDTMEPFDTFRTSNEWGYGGAYFSDVRSVAERLGRNKDAHVYEVFLNIRNPIDVNADFATYYNIERPEEMPPGGTVDTQEIINFARQNGNDGAIVRDVMESTGAGTDYIATEPNQIKDATGRNVGFDPASGNIYLQSAWLFNDEAINILNKYYQQSRGAKGSLSLNQQGQRIINLFESADQSTFVHEMSHMFLLDLQEVAGIDPNSQQAKDLKTIMDWAEYKPGQADEYKGTASAEEFRRREADIQAAEKAGNTLEARRLKDIWAQERFARGFEEYLKSGEAPAAGLKRAFRQFKKWLVQIYNDVLGAGVRATPEVEAIMARMVASEDEIEAMAAANNIARLQKVDPDILSEDAQALRDRWQEEAKERAKEKMLRELMKQYEQQNLKNLDKRLEDVRTSAREELQEMPCFVCEQLLADGTDMASALEICGYDSEQKYRAALKEAGGGMEKALDKMVAQARENMLKEMPSKDALYTMAEEALLSGDYNTRLATLEAEMLKAREASYRNAPARLRRALTEVDEAIKNFETQEVRKAVQKLKYAERWGTKDLQTIQELEKHLADLDKADAKKEEKQKVKEQFEAKYRELKQRTVQNEQWLRDVRDATDGKLKAMRIMARAQMANQQLSAATNPRHWHRQALSEGKKAWQEISRAQRKGEEVNARQAVWAKETQAYFDAMTAEAIKNRQKVDRMLNNARGIKARAKRMADPKFKADANLRHFHNHLLYVFGLRNSDAIAPAQEKTFTDVLAELRASHQFEEEVPAWLIAAAEATTQEKNYQQLTLGEFEELDKLTRVLYTLAKNQNQLLTLDVDMDTVVADCGTDWMNHVDYEVGNQRINDVKGAIGDYMNGLLKPEVLLSIMGGKDGGFIKYIYRVLFKAAEAEEIAREKEAAAQKALYSHYYTQQELRAMVNDPVMVDGPDGTKVKLQIGDDTDITKENLICMALNWGNEANRARLVVGLFDCENNAELAQKQAELMDVLAHTLTEKDWQFIQAMWDHINTFANPVSEVLEKSVGVPLDRVKADAFTVDLPDGQQLNMAGGYYPIVKDSGKSSRQSEFNQLEEAKAVGGVSVFGTGMSATKARTDNLFLNQGPLKLTLDVAHKHIQAQIHLIHAKMAVRDAYKVLNNKAIKDMIRRTCGEGTVKTMNEWVLNCWATPVRPHSWYESMAASLRSKTVGAIMGYRVSTALLNLANVVYMAQEIGTKNALSAMADFYRHPMENRQAILDVSVFMRNRATNMDRDLGAQEEQFLKRHNMVGNAIDKATGGKSEEMRYLMDKYANWLIEQTDMLVSMPLYQWQFKETYSAEIAKGVPEEEARETANFEATRRVTKVFGSSRALDSSSVQRSKNEIVKLITPFFTFANTMMNAVWSHYYEGKYTADKKTFSRRYAAFARAMLFNFVLGALVETMLRQVPDMLAGSGGDDDDDKFMKDVGKNVIANAVAGFPGVNEFINTTYELFTEKKNYGSGRGVGVLSGSVERAQKVIQDMAKITQGGDKIDAIDFFRDVARAANVKTGMSDTITDAVFNTVRFAADGYSLDNMDDLREYIAKTLFDRKLKKK